MVGGESLVAELPKGPYRTEPWSGSDGYHVYDAENRIMCDVLPRRSHSSDAETIARHIAALPELIEAAKRMVTTYINLAAPTTVIHDHFHGPIEELADAVAKAQRS